MPHVSTRRRLVEQAVENCPDGPWQFDFILTAEEFFRLYGKPDFQKAELAGRKPAVQVLIWSIVVMLLLALAGPRILKRLLRHPSTHFRHHSFVLRTSSHTAIGYAEA